MEERNLLTFFAIALGFSAVLTFVGYAARRIVAGRGTSPDDTDGLFEFVIDFALGVAATCFICFISALLHAFYWPIVVAGIAVVMCVAFALGPTTLLTGYANLVSRAISNRGWLVWGIALIVAVPSVLPDITSDGNAFHLIYAKEWADAHALTVDPFVREPLYAMNWLTFDAFFEEIGLGWYTPVLSGLCYVWSVIGIFAIVRRFVPAEGSLVSELISYAATLSFLISPTVMHWNLTGLVDGAIGFFFLATVMAAIRAYETKSVSCAIVFGILAGYFVGLKTSLFLFVPLWIGVAAYLGWRMPNQRRAIILFITVFLVFGSPWYIRNVVLDGDPMAPTFNIMLTGHDAYWSKHDLAGQLGDIAHTTPGIADIVTLPIRLTFDTMDYAFREYGVSLAYLLLYLPFVLLIVDLVLKQLKRPPLFSRDVLILFACFTYAVAYYESTTIIARYSLLFAPALSACLGVIAARCLTVRRLQYVALAVLLVAALPSPASYSWLTYNEQFIIQGLSLDRQTFLAQRLDGYAAAQFVSKQLNDQGSHSSVYEVGSGNLCLVLRRGGNPCVGDWMGPSRFEDFDIAVHEGHSAAYVRRFDIGAFIIRTGGQPISDLTVAMLSKQLAPLHFALAPSIDKRYIVLLRGPQS